MRFSDLPEDFQDLLNPLFNPASPESLASKLPEALSERMLGAIMENPELVPFLVDELEMRRELKATYHCEPTPTEERIRMNLWLEYETAKLKGRNMIVANIHSLACDGRTFYRFIASKPYIVTYFVCKPAGYVESTKEILAHGLRHLRRILDMPETDSKGKLNMKLLELKIKITAMMDLRIHGAPKQSIQQLSVNVTANEKALPGGNVQEALIKGDMHAIQKRLSELEQEKRQIEGHSTPEPEIITVEVQSGSKAPTR